MLISSDQNDLKGQHESVFVSVSVILGLFIRIQCIKVLTWLVFLYLQTLFILYYFLDFYFYLALIFVLVILELHLQFSSIATFLI